ncbi:MAG: dienelactone hydrolase family protein, partial [Pseudomonadota bacterium]
GMIDGFEETEFTHNGKTLPVYVRGEGPGVIIIHEVPGLHPAVIRFGEWVAEAGMTAIMPSLLGTPGKSVSGGYLFGSFARACISREFKVLAAHESSPITDWLRALCRDRHAKLGGPGVGTIGMCLTGNFALSMMMEPSLIAPVLSQPSLPMPIGKARKAALHVSPEELENVKKRAETGCKVLGLRFTQDPMCPPERFETLRQTLGEQFEGIEIDSSIMKNKQAHSVLTVDLIDEEGHPTLAARDRTIEFFKERLLTA